MNKEYNPIDIEVLREFIDGEVNDIYQFVKKHCYKDMYMTIYNYCFSLLNNEDSLKKIIDITIFTYKLQNKLNRSLKVTDGKYFDDYLMKCVCSEIYRKFISVKALQHETEETFRDKVIDAEQKHLNNNLISEYNISFLTSLIRGKFSNKPDFSIEEVIEFIEQIANEKNSHHQEDINFLGYFNNLISKSKLSLHQFGVESLIKKAIYDISLGKHPTKNQLIMMVFTLKLNGEEIEKLFDLAKELVSTSADSNIYSFEPENPRDDLILHWMNNIDRLELIAESNNKKIVEIVNNILKESKFDILK